MPAREPLLLVLAYEAVGPRMAGPAIRSWEIARALGRDARVVLASVEPVERTDPVVETQVVAGGGELERLASEADAVLVHGYALLRHPELRLAETPLVVDLYDPFVFAHLERSRAEGAERAADALALDVAVQNEVLDAGSFFVCASERQRDYWLGGLTARGRLDAAAYAADPTLRRLIDVVPYGCPEQPPRRGPALRGIHPAIPADSFLVLWSGGTWDWFDPVTVLEAFARLQEHEPRARLYFMGLELEGRGVPQQGAARQVRERAEQLGLAGRAVCGGWVPYDERGAYLLDADVAVLATRDVAEVRLAFRSRVVDHFWAGLPTVSTGGDVLSELADREGAGTTVAPGDAGALAEALLRLARDRGARASVAENAARLAGRFGWSRAVEPLRRFLDDPVPVARPAVRPPPSELEALVLERDELVRRLEATTAEVGRVHAEFERVWRDRQEVAAALAGAAARADAAEQALAAVRGSVAWRLTAPLRALRRAARLARLGGHDGR